ncbi:uncharacterized protein LAJ45_10376 [Morchella importuna]|uniref:uncharacterized protein n=1 Tax=Morchella importuna TaxID=1174673 RepID=UPI001E8CA588|nr:uncharacterized protein LAJ45_10376 [Morchella importuna]KAH8145576.1 hypothetical protein LAJ45_10376 [Morchella importuna]
MRIKVKERLERRSRSAWCQRKTAAVTQEKRVKEKMWKETQPKREARQTGKQDTKQYGNRAEFSFGKLGKYPQKSLKREKQSDLHTTSLLAAAQPKITPDTRIVDNDKPEPLDRLRYNISPRHTSLDFYLLRLESLVFNGRLQTSRECGELRDRIPTLLHLRVSCKVNFKVNQERCENKTRWNTPAGQMGLSH